MDLLLLDLGYGLRSLRRTPVFTTLAIVILGLGIGTNSMVFSFVNAFLLRPLPFAEPERLVHVWATDQRQGSDQARVALPTFFDWKAQSASFEDLAVFNYSSETLTGIGVRGADVEPEEISTGRVSANVFDLLGVSPVLGRGFLPDEDQPGRPPVAVISHRFWQERFDGDAAVVGQTVRFDDTSYTVVGVMPPDFAFPLPITEVWLPRVLDVTRFGRDRPFVQVVGRLAPGVSREAAQSELDKIGQRLREAYPETMALRGAHVVPLRQALNFASDVIEPMAGVLLLAAAFILAIVCANLANLMLTRGAARRREMSIRMAVGAGRWRLVRQLLTESVVLAGAGGALGLLVASWAGDWLTRWVPADLYKVGGFGLDRDGIAFSGGLSLLSALLFGLMPALRASGNRVTEGLKASSAGFGGLRTLRTHRVLVVAQVCLGVALLAGCSLVVRSLDNMRRVDPGFEGDRVLSMRLILPASRYAEPAQVASFHREVAARAAVLPGVEAAATVDFLPLNHENRPTTFEPEGWDGPADQILRANTLVVSPDYFRVMGIPVLGGRTFDDRDDAEAPRAVLVNRALAATFWPDEGAVGRRLWLGAARREATIVGVVGNARQEALDDDGLLQLYLAQDQVPQSYLRLLVRSASDPKRLTPLVQRAIWELDPGLPVTEVRTLSKVVEEFLLPQWSLATVLGALGAGAVVLACLGIYGVMAFFVAQRRREIALRMALGARRRDVLSLVLGRGLQLTGIGLLLGLAMALGMERLMQSLLFQVGAGDPVSFVAVPLALAAIAAGACLVPARRAASLDPMTTLRWE